MRCGTPIEQPQRQPEIRLDEEIAVGSRGRRDGAKVDDGVEFASLKPMQQIGRRNELREVPSGKVTPLAVTAENVVYGNVGMSSLVKARTTFDPMKPAPPVTNNIDAVTPYEVAVDPVCLSLIPDATLVPIGRVRKRGTSIK